MKWTSVTAALLVVAIVVIVGFRVDSAVKADVGRGVISIAFDDGRQSQYDYAFPLLKEYGMHGTFYIISSEISDFSGDDSFMSIAELRNLQGNESEIGSHSVTHPDFTSLTDQQIISECVNSKQLLQSNGFIVNNFAYPYGATNVHTDSIVANYYRSARSAYTPPFIMPLPTSQFLLTGYPGETGDPSTVSQLDQLHAAESFVDQAVSSNSYAIIFFHNIIPGDTSHSYEISAEYFEDFLEYVAESGVTTLTVNQALDIAGPSLSASISPSSVNMLRGVSQTFTSNVSGGVSPYTYQWYLNGSQVSGATGSSWTLTPASSGTFNIYLKVADSYTGNVQSNNATAHVKPALVASVSPTQVRVDLGQSQLFTSSVSGGFTPYSYKWVMNGTAVDGATNSTWTFIPTLTGHCNVSLSVNDSLGNRVQSNVVTDILVYNPPSVTVSPSAVNMTVGTSRQFNSTVTGGLAPNTYQWYYANGTTIAGAMGSSLTYKANSTGAYTVYLNATDSLNFKAKSNIVTISVFSQPSVTISPALVNMTLGGMQQFSSSAAGGLTPYTYQWYLNGSQIQNAASSTWVLNATTIGTYNIYLRVTDNLTALAQSNNSTAKVETPVNITISPTQVKIYVNQTQTFNSSVSGGTQPYSYHWYLNSTLVLGAINSNWNFTPASAGNYTVYLNVTDAFNLKYQSNTITDITIYSQPTATISPASVNMTVGVPQTFTSFVTGGLAPYAYQWYLNNDQVQDAIGSAWVFDPTSPGTYNICLKIADSLNGTAQSNNATAQSNNATASVETPMIITISPTQASMHVGQPQTFNSTASGGTTPYIYQWYLNNTPQLGATSSNWTFTPNAAGTYAVYLNVTDAFNLNYQSNTVTDITVYPLLTVSVSPVSVNMTFGGSQTFVSAVSNGTPPFTYQWYVNSSAVEGATYDNYVFTPGANGNYQVYVNVTDSLGSHGKSNVADGVDVYSVYLLFGTEPQATYSTGQQVTFEVTVLNQRNPQLEASLALTVTGPGGYSYYDFQSITVSANGSGEYTFTWVVPNTAGGYLVEANLVPAQLTAYDAIWVESGGSPGFARSSGNSLVVSKNLMSKVCAFFVPFGSQVLSVACCIVLLPQQGKKLRMFSRALIARAQMVGSRFRFC
jgi:peptidoglycan/xylan/chitin deacetylase (PgdA/CDA1 family)